MRILAPVIALTTAVFVVIVATTDSVTLILPILGAAAILVLTFALLFDPSENNRQVAHRDETERHDW